MKKFAIPGTALLIFLIGCSTPEKSSDPQGVSKLVAAFTTAAREGSTEGIMTLFDDSANIMFVGGDSAEIWKGKDQIRGHLQSMFPKEKVSLDMKRSETDIHGDVAWVFADGYIDIDLGDGQKVHAPYRYTMVMVLVNGSWKIRLYNGQNPGGGS
jgi:uncharacterized protein (TIGR02246 family)